ncbi:uncharacterized protein [Clytia hemisphaerica]|uniref:Uncharacterized protein n=1 Tax=Clytia hemisphaerica TaxID=252671 RepID=A0A7M5V715_9CNID
MMARLLNLWILLPVVITNIKISEQLPDFDVNVSQNKGTDYEDCSARSSPCRTLNYALRKCKDNEERIGLCHLIIDGGNSDSRSIYHIDAAKNVTISYKYRLSMEAFDPNVKPIVTCNVTKSGETCMDIEVTELKFSSVDFVGDSKTTRSIFTIVTEGPGFGFLNVEYCSFKDFDMSIRPSKSGSVSQSTFINTRIMKYTGESKPYMFEKGTVFQSSYLEGQFINLESITMYNSSAAIGGYVIEDSKFVGSYYDQDQKTFLPQLKLINSLSISSTTFSDAINGAIEMVNNQGYIVLTSLIFDENKRLYDSDKSIVHFENAGTLEIHGCIFKRNYAPVKPGNNLDITKEFSTEITDEMKLYSEKSIVHIVNTNSITIIGCQFQDNYAPMTAGNNLYIANEHSAETTLDLHAVMISNSFPDQYSLMKIKNITIQPDESWTFDCPPNTEVQYRYTNTIFEYFCLSMKDGIYSTQKSTLSWSNGSFHVENVPIFECPNEAEWTTKGIKSKGNYWGYINNQTGEINFLRCPSTYCCKSLGHCTSYDTCRNGRTGQLCGSCPEGTSISIFDGLRCTGNSCDNQMIWIVIAIDSVVTLLIFIFSHKIFSIFSSLGRERKSYKAMRPRRYRPLRNISDNDQPIKQIEGPTSNDDQRHQIEGSRQNDPNKAQSVEQNLENEVSREQSLPKHGQPLKDYSLESDSESESQSNILAITEHNAHSEHGRTPHNTADMNELCQNQPDENGSYLSDSYNYTNEQPIKHDNAASTQAIIKILFNFYQMAGLILLQTPVQSSKLIPTNIFITLFSLKLQLPSLPWNACPFQTRDIFLIEFIKITPLLLTIALLFIILTLLTVFQRIKRVSKPNEEEDFHQHADGYKKLPLTMRLKCVYAQLLCFGHTSITLLSFQFLHRVTIDEQQYHFIDATIQFTYESHITMASLLILLLWSMPFIFVLYIASIWLEDCKITPNQFLIILTFPPLVILWWCYNKRIVQNAQLNARDAKTAKHLLDIIHRPCTLQTNSDKGKIKMVTESFYLTSRFLLVVACTFAIRAEDRLWSVTVCLLMHLVCVHTLNPFVTKPLNTFESTCIMSLVLMNMTSYIIQSSLVEHIVVGAISGTIVLSFAPFNVYVLVCVVDFIHDKGIDFYIKKQNTK